MTAHNKTGYEHSRRLIADLRSRLSALREQAMEKIREDVGKLTWISDRAANATLRHGGGPDEP